MSERCSHLLPHVFSLSFFSQELPALQIPVITFARGFSNPRPPTTISAALGRMDDLIAAAAPPGSFPAVRRRPSHHHGGCDPRRANRPDSMEGGHLFPWRLSSCLRRRHAWAELGVCPCISWHTQDLGENTNKYIQI